MSRHFVPDKHIRIRRGHEEKNVETSVENQPLVRIWKITGSYPGPKTKVWHYHISVNETVDPDTLLAALQKVFPCGLAVYASPEIINWYIIELEESMEWRLIEKYTNEALRVSP